MISFLLGPIDTSETNMTSSKESQVGITQENSPPIDKPQTLKKKTRKTLEKEVNKQSQWKKSILHSFL